jgi:DNA modification methylase
MKNRQDAKKVKGKNLNGVHFYWSQKKPEIANRIYLKNCLPGAVIFDPFLGGGSSLYGIRNTSFKFIGVELNELPFKIAEFNAKNINKELIQELTDSLYKIKSKYSELYEYKTQNNERLLFHKVLFDNKSNPKIKSIHFINEEGEKLILDNKHELSRIFISRYKYYLNEIKELENPILIKNSRIAIKENMSMSDIFSPINFFLLSKIKKEISNNENLKFIVGSVLHLCKLTDSHSQSQFPFWIPKENILDRNIFIQLENKIKSLTKFIDQKEIKQFKSFKLFNDSKSNCCLLINKPIQNINNNDINDNSIDFVLTDPPYFDQIAYSEYLKIWEFFLNYKSNLKDEIIVSQRIISPSLEKEYLKNINKAFNTIYRKMKNDAKIFIYFKDSRLEKMGIFLNLLKEIGFVFIKQEYIDTPRYTYKQNTSTKTTLSGECILQLKKIENKIEAIYTKQEAKCNPEKLILTFIKRYLIKKKETSLGELFNNGLVKFLYEKDALNYLKSSKSVVKILDEICNYDKEKRKYSLKSNIK